MPHDTSLIATVVAAFALAFGFGLGARRLHMPPLVGYLLAGIVIGPFTPGYVADVGLAGQLAEIGVILLMFGVGLHFSIEDLMRVKGIAIPGAIAQIVVATAMGAALAMTWGWNLTAGVVFGLALSVASTVVLLRALEDNGLIRTQRGQIAVGWLVVEDLAMVVALVLLPVLAQLQPQASDTPAISTTEVAKALLLTLGKVAVFVALMLVVGRRVIPQLLSRVVRTGSRELFTLAVLAIALGVAYGSALLFGVSLALGAFFAGVILSESELSHKAGEDILPLQDAFAVMFFVSVGMLFDPHILLEQPWKLLAVVFVIIVGKSVAAFLIVSLYGYSLRTALTVSASLAQIGEFSFILLALGLSLGLVPRSAQTLVLAGAIFSIAFNPIAFRLLAPVHRWFGGHPRLAAWLDRSTRELLDSPTVVPPDWQGHAVIVGHGRVGSVIAAMFREQGVRYAVVEADRRIVEHLVAANVPAVRGDLADNAVINAVALERARLLAFAIPDSYQLRAALEHVRAANPRLDIVVRTHSDADGKFLEDAGVGLVVMGERELALQMGEYGLRSMGINAAAARRAVVARQPGATG
jgi:CPA2 family monovalent cation:H+ antiporter-2